MRDFKKYDIWKLSHELTLEIYHVTKEFPNTEKYQLISQMQRAAYSIPSNIAEGAGRGSDKDFNRFIQISLGSVHELEYFILLSKDLHYLSIEKFEELDLKINTLKRKMHSLSKKLII
ncbi:four helix bundle protein [Psychroflexus halocasei]|uniref:Four helix bundle protein n=1 Tax=Psychroflexus halocasei TaxID=908615 RepID=A0A1H4D8F7_9FLAO|nr:four helix bundle protein [Psychroflexus halocasei]SEA68858.1 four helix bundle protein [Psychroflexus halocasei]